MGCVFSLGLLPTNSFALFLNFCPLWTLFQRYLPAALLDVITFVCLWSVLLRAYKTAPKKSSQLKRSFSNKEFIMSPNLLCIFPWIWQMIHIIPFILFPPLIFLKNRRERWYFFSAVVQQRRYQHLIWLPVLRTLCKAPTASVQCTSLLRHLITLVWQ